MPLSAKRDDKGGGLGRSMSSAYRNPSRHCEKRSDEAIQHCRPRRGLLRYARNDGIKTILAIQSWPLCGERQRKLGITFGWIEGDAIDVDLEDYH